MMRIGVFDSGVGGITVLSELRRRFPGAEYVYLGDTAHVPYGTRSPAQIKALASGAVGLMRGDAIDVLVVACNTASSLALDEIKEAIGPGVPVYGVVEAGVEATRKACESGCDNGKVLVLATRATASSRIYSRMLGPVLPPALQIVEQSCPLLVPIIEEGWIEHDILHQTVREYVSAHAAEARGGIALLACTHYPWIETAFSRALPKWKIVNSAGAAADLLERNLPGLADCHSGEGPVKWIFTDPAAVPRFAQGLI